MIQAIPNALGALCLNQSGLDQLTARPTIVPGFFEIFISERHQRVLQEKENAVLIGTSIEELLRHHPTLKNTIFDTITSTLDKIETFGKNFVVPDEIKHWYTLQSTIPPSTATPVSVPVDQDVEMSEAEQVQETQQPSQLHTDNDDVSSEDDPWAKQHDNIVVSYIDVFGKVCLIFLMRTIF